MALDKYQAQLLQDTGVNTETLADVGKVGGCEVVAPSTYENGASYKLVYSSSTGKLTLTKIT